MKIFSILLLSILVSCSVVGKKRVDSKNFHYVRSKVSSYFDKRDPINIKKGQKIVLLESNDDSLVYRSENIEVLERCQKVLEKKFNYKVTVDQKPCDDCINIVINHSFDFKKGSKRTNCNSYYGSNSFFGSTQCSSYTPTINMRSLSFFFFEGKNSKYKHQVNVVSSGNSSSVVKVADELCYAAFKDFPQKLDLKEYSIKAISFQDTTE